MKKLYESITKRLDKSNLEIINKSNFLDALKALRDKQCDAIYGPSGGIY